MNTGCTGKPKTETDYRVETVRQFYLADAALVVQGRVMDEQPIVGGGINKYCGLTIMPLRYFKGGGGTNAIRLHLLSYGRTTSGHPLMYEQVPKSTLTTNATAIFFLNVASNFFPGVAPGEWIDLATGLPVHHWQLILPIEWSNVVQRAVAEAQHPPPK